MITRGNPKLGAVVQRYREQAGLSQTEAAKASGLRPSYVQALEIGRFQLIYPDKFNALRRTLRFPGWTVLDAMGYQTDAGDSEMDPRLEAMIRQLPLDKQDALFGMVKAWFFTKAS